LCLWRRPHSGFAISRIWSKKAHDLFKHENSDPGVHNKLKDEVVEMSVRAIDMQITIAKSPDIARDVIAQKKKQENLQHFLSVYEKTKGAREQSKVKKVQEIEMETMRTDVYDSSGNSYGSGGLDFRIEDRYRVNSAFRGMGEESTIDIIA